MTTEVERNWTAQVVLASDHAGLKPEFERLQAEMYHVLARIDDPQKVRRYLETLRRASKDWLICHQAIHGEK